MNRTCSVPDCDKPTRSQRAELCKMHYHRWYRHGSVEKVATRTSVSVSSGRRYVTVYKPGHPVSDVCGKAYVHRWVLYEAIGVGPHECHWCGEYVDWLAKGSPGAIEVDHVNGMGDDNRLANLVASCHDCNTGRATRARSDALREFGWWSHHDTVARLKSNSSGPSPTRQSGDA